MTGSWGQVVTELREKPVYSKDDIDLEGWRALHQRVLFRKKPGVVCAWDMRKHSDWRWCSLCNKWCTTDLENDPHLKTGGKDGHIAMAVMSIHMDNVMGRAILSKGLRNFSQSYPEGAPDFSRETKMAYWGEEVYLFARRVEERHKEGKAVIRIEFSSGKGSSKYWYYPRPDEIKEWNTWLTLFAGQGKYESDKIAQIPWAACPDSMSEIEAIPPKSLSRLGLLPGTKEQGYWPIAVPTFVEETNRVLIKGGYATETFPGSGIPDCAVGICLYQYLATGTQSDPIIGWPSNKVQMRVLAQDNRGGRAQEIVLDTTDFIKKPSQWKTELRDTTTLDEWIKAAAISRQEGGDRVSASLYLQNNLLRTFLVEVNPSGNRCHPVPPPKKKKEEGGIGGVDFLAEWRREMDLE